MGRLANLLDNPLAFIGRLGYATSARSINIDTATEINREYKEKLTKVLVYQSKRSKAPHFFTDQQIYGCVDNVSKMTTSYVITEECFKDAKKKETEYIIKEIGISIDCSKSDITRLFSNIPKPNKAGHPVIKDSELAA